MSDLRVALFVEGSIAPPGRYKTDPLEEIWNDCLAEALGIQAFEPVVPISKKHIVAMDPRNPAMSGAGEALDQLVVRTLKRWDFDAAIVAWDLVPAWNPQDDFCRWQETVDFYRLLSASKVLPKAWREKAGTRHRALARQRNKGSRRARKKLSKHMLLALCMEPMFEGLLVQDEPAIRRAFGIKGRHVRRWPTDGWGDPRQRHPDRQILVPAVAALRRLKPPPPVVRRVRGDMETNKIGWDLFLTRELLNDPRVRKTLLEHELCRRLRVWAPGAEA